jgi:uncharacterized membrane protein YfcA
VSIISFVLAFLCAALSAMGMGGGGILLIYLTAFAGTDQKAAQGINLLFFIPIAIVALILHSRRKLVRWDLTLKYVLLGLPGVYLGWKLAMTLEAGLLSKIFGGFLLLVGLRELFGGSPDAKEKQQKIPRDKV